MNKKIPVPLNIPKDKNIQFDDVAFVNDMSEYSLKVFIKRIWQQLSALANIFEDKRRDVPMIVDRIRSGIKWTKKDVEDRYQYGFHTNFIIRFDTLEREFTLLDNATHKPLTDPIKAVSVTEGKEHTKQKI